MFNFFKKQQPKFIPKKYAIFNVDVFNAWFNDKDNDAIYAHTGIFLRLDKLSKDQVEDYLLKCHNINVNEFDIDNDIIDFIDKIRIDWLKKINNER